MGIAGFWSYSHDDNERDGHRLLRLASHIQDEFALVTGESLSLFIDRNDISWGDEWRRRIGAALAETTFFIPVLTPLYFNRQECRRELLSFVGQAQSLGAIELVLPILYVDVLDLAEDSSDEARALVARMQNVDWRELRLSDETSTEYRRAVHSLANRLAEISVRYEQKDNQEIADEELGENEEEGLLDLLAEIEQKLPEWQDLIDDAEVTYKQAEIVAGSYEERIEKAEKGRAHGPLLVILHNLMQQLEPLSQRLIQDSKAYSAACIELDPLILRVLHELDRFPEASQAVFSALAPIENVAKDLASARAMSREEQLIRKYKGISKDIARYLRLFDAFLRYSSDGDALVSNWGRALQEYKQTLSKEAEKK